MSAESAEPTTPAVAKPKKKRASKKKAAALDVIAAADQQQPAPSKRAGNGKRKAKAKAILAEAAGADPFETTDGVGGEEQVQPQAAARRAGPVDDRPLWQRAMPWLAGLAAVLLFSATIYGWRTAPEAAQKAIVLRPDNVPHTLMAEWVREFPSSNRLFDRPDGATLDAFRAYLQQQPAVARVDRVALVHRTSSTGPSLGIEVILELRKPLLPVMRDSGERAWLSEDGALLPGVVPGPSGLPVVRGLEEAGPEAVTELTELWPRLHKQLKSLKLDPTGAGLISAIRCDQPLAGGRSGIAMYTRQGTVLVWGAPEEDDFGPSVETKVRNLIHTLRCQGDLRRVEEVNVRFNDPFAVLHR